MLKYIELKSGQADKGPAWIARVVLSRSKTTVYFGNKALRRASGISGNHRDIETSEEYWVSGVKKDGNDRHWAGSGKVAIEASAVAEYLKTIGNTQLDKTKFVVIDDLPTPDPARFPHLENKPLEPGDD
jgi:hypothetical protein